MILENVLKVNCGIDEINQAYNIISHGGIAVFPTDTVYGIGCDPYNKKAVSKIYNIKSRSILKPFPVLTYSKETAEEIVCFDEISEKIVKKFWPGPLTIILKVSDQNLIKSLNLRDKIAIRVPNQKCTLDLLKKCKFLVGTSANLSRNPSHTDPEECLKNIEGWDIFIDGGIITGKGESTIIEVDNGEIKIIREGYLSKEDILKQ